MKIDLSKDQFVAVLEAAGINATLRGRLHHEFERQQPGAHQKFLEWLGLTPAEIAEVRTRSRATK